MRKLLTIIERNASAMGFAGLLFLWSTAVAFAFALLIAHESTPGETNPLPMNWPSGVAMQRCTDRPMLLVFIHPQCPCTMATLSELERLTAEVEMPVQTTLIINCPADQETAWKRTAIWRRCESVSKGSILVDFDGELATQFRIGTSGHCALYSAAGKLLFQGGITASRGHEGESTGRVAIRAHLSSNGRGLGKGQISPATPVFGCELIQSSKYSPTESACCKDNQS